MGTSTQRPYWAVSLLSSALLLELSWTACPYPSSSTSSQTTTPNSNPISTQPPWRNEGRWDLPRGQRKSSATALDLTTVTHTDLSSNPIEDFQIYFIKCARKNLGRVILALKWYTHLQHLNMMQWYSYTHARTPGLTNSFSLHPVWLQWSLKLWLVICLIKYVLKAAQSPNAYDCQLPAVWVKRSVFALLIWATSEWVRKL